MLGYNSKHKKPFLVLPNSVWNSNSPSDLLNPLTEWAYNIARGWKSPCMCKESQLRINGHHWKHRKLVYLQELALAECPECSFVQERQTKF